MWNKNSTIFFKKFLSIFLINLLILQSFYPLYASTENPDTVLRESWFFNETDTSTSGTPSNLKYFKHFNALPEEINMKIFDEQDLSHLQGKRLFVGYGIADPKNGDCKVFPASETGYDNDITVCLPWWRIEREYIVNSSISNNANTDIIQEIRKNTKPPIMYKHCKKWEDNKEYPGGKVTCTSYYDRLASPSCWDNPERAECWVDNCSENIKNFCKYIDNAMGDKTTLETATVNSHNTPEATSTKLNLVTHQYECPAGPLVQNVKCLDEVSATIYPQKCADEHYEYCDERRPNLDANGNLISYFGTCSNGVEIECKANTFSTEQKICVEPIYQNFEESEIQSSILTRDYETFFVDVLSGESDIYMSKDNCLRANSVTEARDQELLVRINGNGSLDDDIYVIRHLNDNSHIKVYCNMQHAATKGNKKNYNGEIFQCIGNDGTYSFDETIAINPTDIVTVQQNTENENHSGEPFSLGRTHYRSTKVTIDEVEVAPETFNFNFPHYPVMEGDSNPNIKLWDNTTGTFSLLFPFAGAYDIRFYNKNNQEVAKSILNVDDFKSIAKNGSMQLKLGKQMQLAPGMEDDSTNSKKANREDMWVEWGGGVYGGKDSLTGEKVLVPNDSFVKDHAVYSIIVKDLNTGTISPIPLVYPLAYPNRVFVSKLKVYEKRKYRCYNEFPDVSFLGDTTSFDKVCNSDANYIEYKNGFTLDPSNITKWDNDELCKQNCRDFQECKVINNKNYTCEQRGGENIGGDIEGNEFSSLSKCNEKCFKQSECVNFSDSRCILVDEKVSEPVSDKFGKTVFRQKELAYKCTNSELKQIGCTRYKITTTEGEADFAHNAEFETFDFSSNFEKSMAHAANLEVGILHIWSGWSGKCVVGKKWDFSFFADPMTIVSYAMMAYSSYEWSPGGVASGTEGITDASNLAATGGKAISTWEQFVETVSGYATDFQKNWDTLAENITTRFNDVTKPFTDAYNDVLRYMGEAATNNPFSDAISNISKSVENMSNSISSGVTNNPLSNALGDTYNTVSGGVNNFYNNAMSKLTSLTENTFVSDMVTKMEGSYSKISEFLTKDIIGKSGDWVHITYGKLAKFGINLAFSAAAPKPEAYIKADQILKGYYGMSSGASDVVAYNSCMASIGLSFPNLLGWAWDDKNDNLSEQLKAPWENPIRLTVEQIGAIAASTSKDFLMNSYLIREDNDDFLTSLIAITPEAFYKAGQVLCAGSEVSKAMDHIQQDKNSAGSGISAQTIALATTGFFCPPCQLAATLALDLATNVFAGVNTCENEEDALQWDILNYKTHKFLKQEQCHFVKTECDQKTSWMGCVRQRKEYCCYDMVLTRIFAEGLKEQLGKNWDSCNDITINDLKEISFNECLPNQDPKIHKCMPTGNYNDFERVLFRQATKKLDSNTMTQGLLQQIQNSMAIEGK